MTTKAQIPPVSALVCFLPTMAALGSGSAFWEPALSANPVIV